MPLPAFSCSSCLYYRELPALHSPDDGRAVGHCRIVPPVPILIASADPTTQPHVESVWPMVRADDWCGRYVMAPRPGTS